MCQRFILAEAGFADEPQETIIVVYSIDAQEGHSKLKKILGDLPAMISTGETLVEAINKFNFEYRSSGDKLNDDEQVWYRELPIGENRSPLFYGDFMRTPEGLIRPIEPPGPIGMPNGQKGYICTGNCHEFYAYVEANHVGGFICSKCK